MNPFEFVLLILILAFGYSLLSTWMKQRRVEQRRAAREAEANEDLLGRLAQLEERVKVLERIVTDERFDLRQQFRELGR
jgi:membrane protein implicated in regulation of membrane protease activity